MAKLLMWNLSRLGTKSKDLTGPLPDLYLRDLVQMVGELNGVYLSGIQVGDARRFCVANPQFKDFPAVIYNPVIVDQYDLVKSEGEGCLSFPGLWVKIPRYKYVIVKYRDGQWNETTATFGNDDLQSSESLLAKAIQHEIAHMDGIVVFDRVQDKNERLKIKARVLVKSAEQNKQFGIPQLIEGPKELDPCLIKQNTLLPEASSPLPSLSTPNSGNISSGNEGITPETAMEN